jgi:hypothetical protein
MKKSTRTTISVPAALKERMEQVEGVNWSAIACRAFEAKLAEIITKKGAKDMEDVVARLKASKAKTGDADKIRGREAGREWASSRAEAVELERLEAYTEADFGGWSWEEWLIGPHVSNGFSDAHMVAEAVTDEGLDRRDAESFWITAIGELAFNQMASATFLVGFVKGAMEVWSKVKDEV